MRRLLSTEFTVGTFALFGLLVIIYMSLKVNDRGAIGGASHGYFAKFASVAGLVRKVPVEVAGIAVGHVDQIELVGTQAKVSIRVRKDLPVYADAVLTIRDRGILGDKFVMMNPGTPGNGQLSDGGEIVKTHTQSDFDQIAESLADTASAVQELIRSDNPRGALGQVVVNLRDMSKKLNGLVGDNEGRISRLLANMESFSSNLNEITDENKDQIHTVLVSLGEVADSMKDVLGKNGQITQATERFNQSMASLEKVVSKVERGEGTIGKLVNDETTVNKINDAVEGLSETLGLFRKVQLNIRYRGEYLTSAEKLQNLIGLSIAPAPDKYLLFELIAAPVGETKKTDTTISTNGTVLSTTQTVQTNDNILFTLMLAKRFWDLTVRFGLLRSKGGAALDYSLWNDKFVVSVEGFDFSRVNNRPHLRAYATLTLYKHLLLTGGMDDIITEVGGRNPFFGAGIQFTDQDLKALVTLLPRSGL